MGLDITSIRYHCWLKKQGASFKKVAMLGRHTFYGLTPATLARAVAGAGFKMEENEARGILTAENGYAEPFYRWLGSEVVDSFDYSAYEQATHLWDMNQPLPAASEGQYDFVFDGGTLEHVFRYSDALREAMTLPKVGGIFLSATPANSYLGHGFYQFGPDLPFSVIREENGYHLENVHLIEMRHRAIFHEVLPPCESRGRALAATPWPALMYFWGRREGAVPQKLEVLQPDYEAAWKGSSHQERASAPRANLLRKILGGLPNDVRNDFLRLAKLGYTVVNRNAFFDKNCFRAEKSI